MADRVVVMRAGRIEQAADPITLYERPMSRFVANFIGSPAMKFLPARIEGDAVRLGGQTLALPPQEADRLGRAGEVVFGIRPEHMRPSGHQARLTMTPEAIEPLGPHTLVLGRVGEERVTAQVDPRFAVRAGEPCELPVDMTQAHFFDPATEARL